jgi:phosphodiesterase/alkaline phosphatase D-like protein
MLLVFFGASAWAAPPVITKVWSWNVAGTAAGLSMSVDNKNVASNAYFLYGTDAQLKGAAKAGERQMQASTGIQQHASLTGLAPNTTYYYRAVVTNSGGTAESPIQSFKTSAAAATPPTVSNLAPSKITDKSAHIEMVVNNIPIATSVSYVYATKQDFSDGKTVGQGSVGPGASGSASRVDLSGLTPKTNYYVKGVASNKDGTASATTQFRTAGDGPAPVVTKVWSWNVTSNAGGLSMSVDNKDLISNAHFLFGTDAKLAGAAKLSDGPLEGAKTGIQKHATLKDLKPGTTYYYKAVVNNVNGSGESAINSFTTAK